VAEGHEPRRPLTPEQVRRRRRRSVALALLLALLAVLFYVMALVQGPAIIDRPL
jgi:ferric-dicitrate binding protein FerR (iron transport regulator)